MNFFFFFFNVVKTFLKTNMDEELKSLGFSEFGMRKRTHFQPRGKNQNKSSTSRPLDKNFNIGSQKKNTQQSQEPAHAEGEEAVSSVIQDKTVFVNVGGERKLLKQIGPFPETLKDQKFPISQELAVNAHSKRVSALIANVSGTQIYTGSDDCTVKYWGFPHMNPIRQEPKIILNLSGVNKINSIDVTDDGQLVMFSTGSPEIQFFTDTGLKKGETRRGDMYVFNKATTFGHTTEVTCAQFKPHDKDQFASISMDGSLRFWDTNKLQNQTFFMKLNGKGEDLNPGKFLRYSPDGSGVYTAALDSSIKFWCPGVNVLSIPQLKIKTPNKIGAIATANDGYHIAGRLDEEGYVLIYDIRNTSKPVFTFEADSNLPSVCFSPDSKYILVPEIVHPRSRQGGSVQFVDMTTGKSIDDSRIWLPTSIGARCVIWHEKTNQIMIGCEDGAVRVLFDKKISKGGAIATLEKGFTVKAESDEAVIGQMTPELIDPEVERIINGFWFPFTDEAIRDKRSTAMPKAPLWGDGHHGQIATHPFQVQLKLLGQIEEPDNQDIVEALRSRNKDAQVRYFTRVQQRRKILDSDYDDDENNNN